MLMTPEVAALVSERASHSLIVDAATRGGTQTLWADGLDKAAAGLTTIDELSRIVR
jgi:type II secretory ATPase GspE/PulE/Tfp pilus assembly ATPase PilB-like protein